MYSIRYDTICQAETVQKYNFIFDIDARLPGSQSTLMNGVGEVQRNEERTRERRRESQTRGQKRRQIERQR